MLLTLCLFIAGLALLVIGADCLVNGASRIARSFQISPLVIGLTIVAFGTSLPESAATVSAALNGHTDLAMGNIVGSNIYNLLLILGIAAVIAPLTVTRQLVKQEVPFMIGASILFIVMIQDGLLSRLEAAFLFCLSIIYTIALLVQSRRLAKSEEAAASLIVHGEEDENSGFLDRIPAAVLIIAGLLMLMFGGQWLVSSATALAEAFGVSDLVIGLTVVAIGTSMPEVATCVLAVLRNQRDLAVGNVVGSNIFNILVCLGLSGMVASNGLPAPSALLNFDVWVMLAVACVTIPILISGAEVSRWEGYVLLFYCAAYIAYSLFAATHHDLLPAYSVIMLAFVIPLTLIVFYTAIFGRKASDT